VRHCLQTFLATLAILSYIPVLAFLYVFTSSRRLYRLISCLKSAASSCTLIFALVISLSAGFAVILVLCKPLKFEPDHNAPDSRLVCVLISTLAASVFVAAVITAACLYIYLAFRLVSLVRQYGASKGILCWIDEIWKHTSAIGSMTLPLPFRRQVNSAAIQHQQPSYESTEDSDLDTKVEG